MSKKIIIAADHGGYSLKEALKPRLAEMGLIVTDMGTDSDQAVDYPDFGAKAAGAVSTGLFQKGILICGSGVGMSIVANRFPGVRAALCLDEETARLSRTHNDANSGPRGQENGFGDGLSDRQDMAYNPLRRGSPPEASRQDPQGGIETERGHLKNSIRNTAHPEKGRRV
jgi:RpiB/LacA/LacB family sugar-phosphate isomerase